MAKIYDCFPLFNELELLHIRLELLYDIVDHFVISECDSTFSGLDKPFYFEENRHIFKKYEDKIIYVKNINTKNIENIQNTYTDKKKEIFDNILFQFNSIKNTAITDFGKHHWCRDFIHKEFIMLGLDKCEDDDIIIFSDLDEIPDPEKMKFDNTYTLNMKNMCYSLNKENTSEKWYGSVITKYSNIKNGSLQKLRGNRLSYNIIQSAGWHLTSMGGIDRVIQKIKSWGHQEFNKQNILSNVSNNISNNKDIFNRNNNIINIDISGYYPLHIINFINIYYPHLIK